MKTKLIILGIFILMLFVILLQRDKINHKNKDIKTYQNNTNELLKQVSEQTKTIVLTPKEIRKLPYVDSILKLNDVLNEDLKSLHSIKYDYKSIKTSKTDTIYKPIFRIDTVFWDNFEQKYNLTWYFDHGCFQNIVRYDPNNNIATDSLVGEINIERITYLDRPKNWFWRLKWRKSKWATETKVISNCPELNIKENASIEVR